jgi:hypothetical protein
VSAPGQAAARAESAWRPSAVRVALTAQLRVARRFAHRLRQVAVQRSELPAEHPPLRLRAVSPETELDSRALRRAGSAIPKVLVLRPLAVRTAALE